MKGNLPVNDIAKKIKELRERLGIDQIELARRLGDVNQSTVSKWERGLQKPNAERQAKLAEAAGVTVGEWLGIEPTSAADFRGKTVMVVGDLQAGAWREAIEWDYDDQYPMPVIMDPSRPSYPMQGFVVRGTSMNRPYPEGSHVFVASTISNGLTPRNGDHVLVIRRNKRGLYEATLKEYVVNEDGSRWLWPRSTDPQYQAPMKINGDDSEEVTIAGIVQGSFVSGPRRE
jgi:repressor LexA